MTKASKYSLIAISAALIATAVYYANTDTPQPQIRAFAAVPTIRPKVITKGGHYSGTFVGNKDSAAIWIWTTDSVFLDSPVIYANAGGGIRMAGGTKVIVANATIKGITPVAGVQYGRAIDNYQPAYFYMKSFNIDSTGGILFDHSKAGTQPLIQLYNGTISNTLGITGDGKEAKPRAGIQFNTVVNMNPASEAAWIEIRNDWMKSRVEDCFNFYNSSNFRFHDFCIKGAYNLPGGGKSLSGITVDGSVQEGNNRNTASHNFEAYNGYIISTFNAAMNIAAGYNNYMHGIVAVSSGMTRDGVRSALYWSGSCIFRGSPYPDSIFYGNRISGNTLGYIGNSGRQDENKDRNVNKMPVGGNKYLPEPITLATEDSVYRVWRGKFAGDVVPVVVPPVVPMKRDTVTLHDTFYYYITSRYGVVGIDTVKVKK